MKAAFQCRVGRDKVGVEEGGQMLLFPEVLPVEMSA